MILFLVRAFPLGNQGNNWRHACASVRQAKGESHSAWRELAAAFAGDAGSNSSSAAILAGFANFHGVTVKSTVWLDAALTLRSLHRRFDNVADPVGEQHTTQSKLGTRAASRHNAVIAKQ